MLSVLKKTQSQTAGDDLGFRYEAATLPDGTDAVYGAGTDATARGMTRVDVLPVSTAANPAVFAVAGHVLQDGDIVRVTNMVGGTSGVAFLDGAGAAFVTQTFTVAATVDNVSFALADDQGNPVRGDQAQGVVAAGALISRETALGSNHRDITLESVDAVAHHQFRGCVVYDSLGNLL